MVAACGVSAQVTAKHDGLHHLYLLASQEWTFVNDLELIFVVSTRSAITSDHSELSFTYRLPTSVYCNSHTWTTYWLQ